MKVAIVDAILDDTHVPNRLAQLLFRDLFAGMEIKRSTDMLGNGNRSFSTFIHLASET